MIVIGTCAAVIEKADEFHDRLAVDVEYENSQTAAAWAHWCQRFGRIPALTVVSLY